MPKQKRQRKKLPESLIQRKVIDAYEADGWLVVKIIQSTKNGWPDIQCHKKGVTIFIECKAEGEKNDNPLQLYRQQQLRQQGFTVLIINNIHDAKVS